MAKKRYRTKVNTITCPACKDELYSRATHDFRACKCGAVFVDGGFDYFRCGYEPKSKEKVVFRVRYVPCSKEQLYDDWNLQENKYGKIN